MPRHPFRRPWRADQLRLPPSLVAAVRALEAALPRSAERAAIEEALSTLRPEGGLPRGLDPFAPGDVPLPPVDAHPSDGGPSGLDGDGLVVLGSYRRMASPGRITLYAGPIFWASVRLWLTTCGRPSDGWWYDTAELLDVVRRVSGWVLVHERFHHFVDTLTVLAGRPPFYDAGIEEPLAQGYVLHALVRPRAVPPFGRRGQGEWRLHHFLAMAPSPYRDVLGARAWPGLPGPADLSTDVEAYVAVVRDYLGRHGAVAPTTSTDALGVLLLNFETCYAEVVWEEAPRWVRWTGTHPNRAPSATVGGGA